MRAPGRVLAVSGLAREARIASGDGVETCQAGGDPTRLRAALEALLPSDCRAVISFGLAGGLDPDLRPGDIVIASAVVTARRQASAPGLVAAYRRRLSALDARVTVADIAGVETAVLSPAAKSDLRTASGAAIVDMESHVAADYAALHGVPFCALRVVCDPAERTVPKAAAAALKPNGAPDVVAVLSALARRDLTLPALLRLAKDSGTAFAALGRARALLGFALGVDP